MKFLFLIACCFSFAFLEAQTVVFNESSSVERMIDKYITTNKNTETIKGWRIQIVSTDDRRNMEATKAKFDELYPEINSSWNHLAPYYQVRAGAYEDKTKLMAFLMEIKDEFPMATPVVDDIEKTEFLR
jgi:hypothetical protein